MLLKQDRIKHQGSLMLEKGDHGFDQLGIMR